MYTQQMDLNVLTLFKDIVAQNPDAANRAFYVDGPGKLAFGGYRRGWGLGDLIVRYTGEIEWSNIQPGIYDIETNEFINNVNLPTKRTEGGAFNTMGPEELNDRFAYEYDRLERAYTMRMNPTDVLNFISDATYREGVQERVINIEPFYRMNAKKHFAARLQMDDEGRWLAVLEGPRGQLAAVVQVDKSYINFDRVREGDWAVFEIVGEVEGCRYVKAMRMFSPGIRMAVQYFRSGAVMLGQARYSVIPNEDGNTITDLHVKDFPFIAGQDLMAANYAPMLTIQLDTFQRIMRALSTFKMVELRYIDSHSPFLVYGLDEKGYRVECLSSAISPFKNGKVITV